MKVDLVDIIVPYTLTDNGHQTKIKSNRSWSFLFPFVFCFYFDFGYCVLCFCWPPPLLSLMFLCFGWINMHDTFYLMRCAKQHPTHTHTYTYTTPMWSCIKRKLNLVCLHRSLFISFVFVLCDSFRWHWISFNFFQLFSLSFMIQNACSIGQTEAAKHPT